MELSTCSTCGIQIGGQNHVDVASVTRLTDTTLKNLINQKGYIMEVVIDKTLQSYESVSQFVTQRPKAMTVMIMRLLMHIVFKMVLMNSIPEQKEQIVKLLHPNNNTIRLQDVQDTLNQVK